MELKVDSVFEVVVLVAYHRVAQADLVLSHCDVIIIHGVIWPVIYFITNCLGMALYTIYTMCLFGCYMYMFENKPILGLFLFVFLS